MKSIYFIPGKGFIIIFLLLCLLTFLGIAFLYGFIFTLINLLIIFQSRFIVYEYILFIPLVVLFASFFIIKYTYPYYVSCRKLYSLRLSPYFSYTFPVDELCTANDWMKKREKIYYAFRERVLVDDAKKYLAHGDIRGVKSYQEILDDYILHFGNISIGKIETDLWESIHRSDSEKEAIEILVIYLRQVKKQNINVTFLKPGLVPLWTHHLKSFLCSGDMMVAYPTMLIALWLFMPDIISFFVDYFS